MRVSCAGLIYGLFFHYIDHLAPLCSQLEIPLLVTEEDVEKTVRSFYPKVKVILINAIALPEHIVENFSIIFICSPRLLFDEICFFAQAMRQKKVHTIWCPHGNSDKGNKVGWMEALEKERALLVYGKKMVDFLQRKQVVLENKHLFPIGNYRKRYYEDHKALYDQMVGSIVGKTPPKENAKTILYAPTWEDAESSSSFYKGLPYLIETLPENWKLLIKPHPNLLIDPQGKGEEWMEAYTSQHNVVLIKNFPPIYPLLAASSIYIGDLSSIGYDALFFSMPMFFLSPRGEGKDDPSFYLYRCGVEIFPEDYAQIYNIVEAELPKDQELFANVRKEVYDYTFSSEIETKELREKMNLFCQTLVEEELDVFF